MQNKGAITNYHKLTEEDYSIPCYELANYLLGKILVRKFEGKLLKGRIVETECYLGGDDKASHSYKGKQTPRNQPMFMPPGTSYVYMTYGMYHCFNISAKESGAAVLLRALQPIEGLDCMRNLRSVRRLENAKVLKDVELCNGPSKLCIAMNINKNDCNKLNLCQSDELYLETDFEYNDNNKKVIKTSRIGIDSAGEEWAKKLLRFYIAGNPCVSRKDKKAEQDLLR